MLRRILAILSLVTLVIPSNPVQAQDRDTTRVEKLMRQMPVSEKLGQLLMGFFTGPVLSEDLKQQIRTIRPGGVILYGGTGNIENPRQISRLLNDIQGFAKGQGVLPLFISIDQEGGRVTRILDGVTVFPGNMALGATGETALASKQAGIMATELRSLGITMNFAPSVDVNSNPANPVIGTRSFGSEPGLVARFGEAMIEPYRQAKVIATAKHFPGHGDTDVDSHFGLPAIQRDRQQLSEVELPPFVTMIKRGVPAVMTAHVVVPALDPNRPATLSPIALGLLRRDMRFNGLIISDSLGMGAIDQRYGMGEAAVQAFLAGADILLFGADKGHSPQELQLMYRALSESYASGRITQRRLDESLRRILLAKLRYGVLDDPLPRGLDKLAAPQSLAVAREIAQKSLTLVRNAHLPLQAKIPVVWPLEKEGALNALLANGPNLAPVVVPLDNPALALNAVKDAPVVAIVTYDLAKYPAWREFARSLGKRALVLSLGAPYDLLQVPEAGTYVAAYGDRGVTMQALGELLQGKISPRGTLPVELPGLYPLGFGLKDFAK